MAMDTPQMFEDGLYHVCPDFRVFFGWELLAMSEGHRNEILGNILKTSLIDSIRIEGTKKLVEWIITDDRDWNVNYVVDSSSSGVYEMRVLMERPKKNIEIFKNWLLAQFDALSIYYQKANILNPNACPNFYRFKIFP